MCKALCQALASIMCNLITSCRASLSDFIGEGPEAWTVKIICSVCFDD